MEQQTFEVVEVHKITDVDPSRNPEGVYELDITLRINGVESREPAFISTPDCAYGANPAVRRWMNQNPQAMVHPFVPYVPTPEEIKAATPPLSARQLRLGLARHGFFPSQVDSAIAAMPEGLEKATAQIEWEYATTFNRAHPLIASIGAVLGLTETNIDDMWQEALAL